MTYLTGIQRYLDKVMNIVHTQVMSYQRITVSIPKNIYKDLLNLYGKGKISKALTQAARRQVLEKKLEPSDPVEAFLQLRKITTKRTLKQILAGIKKGRT